MSSLNDWQQTEWNHNKNLGNVVPLLTGTFLSFLQQSPKWKLWKNRNSVMVQLVYRKFLLLYLSILFHQSPTRICCQTLAFHKAPWRALQHAVSINNSINQKVERILRARCCEWMYRVWLVDMGCALSNPGKVWLKKGGRGWVRVLESSFHFILESWVHGRARWGHLL